MRVVNEIEPVRLYEELQAQLQPGQPPRVAVAQDDYYETGGIVYSVVHLTRADLEALLAMLPDDPR